MTKEKIVEELSLYREKQEKLALKKLEKKRKCIEIKRRKRELRINITPKYTEGGKPVNKISSTVENTVIEKDERIRKLEEEIATLDTDIALLEIDIKQLDVRLDSLTYLEKEIITAYYVDNMSMKDIGLHTYYKVKHQTRDRRTIKNIIEKIKIKMEKL